MSDHEGHERRLAAEDRGHEGRLAGEDRGHEGRLAGDIASAIGRQLASALSGIATVAVVARTLGAERLGAWTLIGTLAYLLGLADLGLSTAVQRSAVTADDARTRRLLGLAYATIGVAAPLLAAGALAFLGLTLGRAPGMGAHEITTAAAIALGGGVVGALAFPMRAVLLVRGGVRESSLARTVAAVLQVALTLALSAHLPSLAAPSLALALALAVETALLARALRARAPGLACRPSFAIGRGELRALVREAGAPLAINAAVAVAQRLDVFVLASVAPLWVVAAYGVTSRACDQALTLAKQTSSALLGRFGDARTRVATVRLGSAILGSLASAGLGALGVLGSPLLAKWAGPSVLEGDAARVLPILAVAFTLAAWSEVPCAALAVAAPSPWAAARPVLIGCAVNGALTLAVARAGGVVAVALATVAGNVLIVALVWRRAAELLAWSRGEVARALAPGLASLGASLGLALALRGALHGAVGALVGCAAASALGLAAGAATLRLVTRRPSAEAAAGSAVAPMEPSWRL